MTRLRRITSPSKLHGCLICTKVARKLFQFNREVIKFQAEKTNTAPWPGAVQGKPTAPPAGPHTRNTGSLGPAGRQFGGPGGCRTTRPASQLLEKKRRALRGRAGQPPGQPLTLGAGPGHAPAGPAAEAEAAPSRSPGGPGQGPPGPGVKGGKGNARASARGDCPDEAVSPAAPGEASVPSDLRPSLCQPPAQPGTHKPSRELPRGTEVALAAGVRGANT